MNISTEIFSNEIQEIKLITPSCASSYHFVSADFVVQVDSYQAILQTGHSYYHSDYSQPSNALEVYEGCELLVLLDGYTEIELEKQDVVDYINEEAETEYSLEEMLAIYNALNEIIGECQSLVSEAEGEADELLEADSHIYVLTTDTDDCYGTGDYVQCAPSYSMRFDSEEDASEFIEEQEKQKSWARIVDKETGVYHQVDDFSNF